MWSEKLVKELGLQKEVAAAKQRRQVHSQPLPKDEGSIPNSASRAMSEDKDSRERPRRSNQDGNKAAKQEESKKSTSKSSVWGGVIPRVVGFVMS